jgi:hypothetical protein
VNQPSVLFETRYGEVTRQLGEVQRHERLAEDDERPCPEDGWSADTECHRLVRERPRRNADVAECDREIRQETKRPLQLGFDPERA